MVWVSLHFIVGILIQSKLQLGLVAIGLLLVCFFLIQIFIKYDNLIFITLLIVLAGCLRSKIDDTLPVTHLSKVKFEEEKLLRVTAIVDDIGETRRGTPRFVLSPLLIDDQTISGGSMILYAKDIQIDIQHGDTLIASMVLSVPRSQRNPHEFNYRTFLAGKDIHFEAFLDDAGGVDRREVQKTSPGLLLSDLKKSIINHFNRYLSPRSSGILSALILGEKGDIEDSTRADFANTGVIHVLAVSGLHVGYVTMILVTIFGLLRLPHSLTMTCVILGLLFYVGLTGAAPSVMRASIMASLIIIAGLLQRKSDILNLLAAAAFIILVISPDQLTNIGFQLSFLAVLSIVTLYPVFKEITGRFIKPGVTVMGRSLNSVIDLFLVSLAAQLGTLGVTIFYFNKIPIISLLANIIVVPLIGVIVATGMSFLILGSLLPGLAKLWAATLEGLVDFMLWFVQLCAQADWAYLTVRQIDLPELTLLMAGIFALTIFRPQVAFRSWVIISLTWFSIGTWKLIMTPNELEVVMLDVGQGDALLIHTPNGKTMLVDAGLRFGGKDMGKDVIAPYLHYRNWSYIDLMILSHPHNDHMGGAEYLIENLDVGKVLMPDIEYESFGYNKLRETIESRGIPTAPVFAGHIDSSLKPLYFRVNGPRWYDESSQPSNVNDASLVLQLFYGESTLLLTGDAEIHVERDQLPLGNLLRSDIIKAPHHGSKTSSMKSYLEYVQPEVCLISLGKKNKFRHPSQITLDRYNGIGAEVFRTDQQGAIMYRSDGHKWLRERWRKENI